MTIGQRIKQRREELQISQEELAIKIGYKSRSSINKIELDRQQLTQRKIKAIADALNTTANWILGIDDEVMQQEQQLCDLFSMCYGKESYEAVQMFLKLDGNDKNVVITMIKSMLSTDKYQHQHDIKISKGDTSITA